MVELHGEKIDIVDWSEDPARFLAEALQPAKVSAVEIVDPVARSARIVVPDYQLSLAIGREGQNARLAARLTGWRIDIRPDVPVGGAPGAGERAEPDLSAVPPAGPVRTCVGCRSQAPVGELLRVVAVDGRLRARPGPPAARPRRAPAPGPRLPGTGRAPARLPPGAASPRARSTPPPCTRWSSAKMPRGPRRVRMRRTASGCCATRRGFRVSAVDSEHDRPSGSESRRHEHPMSQHR